jgi:Flp pilus assembly protein TadD
MARTSILLAGLVLCLAACGSSSHHSAARTSAPRSTTLACSDPRTVRDTARLRADVAAIRAAARKPTKDTFNGNAAVNRATDRFLADEGRAHVSLLAKNRFIDHAAGALTGSCQQCFQALEAERPIPSISHAGACGLS